MAPWIIWLIAIVSTAICLFLWFRDVRRIMRNRMSTVESAAGQLASCRIRAAKAENDPEAAAILARSENIYRQAVELYNQTMRKPWIYLPAVMMKFEPVYKAGIEWGNNE